jgi:hypothetical protein
MENFNWPSRDEWAEGRRTVYGDMLENVECSRQLSDYATSDEIATLTEALTAAWKAFGRTMAKARSNPAIARVLPQKGETDRAYTERQLEIGGGLRPDTDLADEYFQAQYRRSDIRKWQREMAENRLPDPCSLGLWVEDEELQPHWYDTEVPFLIVLRSRYRATWQAALATYRAEVEARPIDDEAWAQELKRRAGIEEWRVSLKTM